MPRVRPLIAVTIALLLGLLPALRFGPPPLLLAGLLLVTIAVTTAVAAVRPSSSTRDGGILAAFAMVGALLGATSVKATAADCRNSLEDGTPVSFSGRLGAASMAVQGSTAPLLPLEGARIEVRGGGVCAGTVRVRLPEVAVRAGSRVEGRGEWIRTAPLRSGSWPMEPLFVGYLATDTLTGVSALRPVSHPLLFLRGAAEARLVELFPRHYPLAQALILGRRERMDDEVKDRFVRAGLVHLLAISGAHVALFATMLLLVGGAAGLSPDRVRIGTIAVTALYLALIGAPGSAVRAGIMLSLALCGRIMQRPSSGLAIMSAAALALVAWDPSAVLDPGVQLSFAGVAALMLAARIPRDPLPPALRAGLGRIVVDAVLVSVLAFLVTAPITAHHFGAVSPVSIVANLPAVPLTSLALIGVVAALAVAPVSLAVARLIADGGALALDLVDRVAATAAAAPFGFVHVARPDWTLWACVGAATLLASRWLAASRVRLRWGVCGAVAVSVLLAWPSTARVGEGLELYFLDVGQGDAIAIRTPGDRWLLVDAGPRERNYDAGERRVLPFLSARGVTRVEGIILTHPHADHIGGAAALLGALEVGRVVEPGLPAASDMYHDLLALTERKGVQWARARRGRDLLIDGVELRFLWPAEGALGGVEDANAISAVVMLRYGEFRALLTGDAPAEVERELVRLDDGGLDIDILKAGHHGSRTSTSAELLAASTPEIAVISAGRRNRFGHPSPEVIERLAASGVAIARTDLDGTVGVRVRATNGYQWEWIDR